MRILAVTTMRNEAPFLLEWIAYHQHIGVTDFLIYTNDCEDGTDVLLDRLDDMGVVTHERNHSVGKKSVQWRALTKAWRHTLTTEADWIFVSDVDEFLCIHAGDGKITDLLNAAPGADGFAIPWRMFGNAGVVTFDDASILQEFVHAAPEALLWPWRAVQFKSLYKNHNRYEKLGVHSPKLVDGEAVGHWVDGNGAPMPSLFGTVMPTLEPRYGLAQINHYALGSMESFLAKVARGKPNHMSDPIDLAYWSDRNFCSVVDKSILKHQADVASRVDALRQDAEIDRLHMAGVAWRKAAIQSLLRTSDAFYMMARLRQMPPTRVLPAAEQMALYRGLMTVRQLQAKRKRAAKSN
jgi:hypothetical protein